MSYPLGSLVGLTVEFYDESGALADPAAPMVLYLEAPGGGAAPSTPTVTRDSLGAFHYDLLCSIPGQWRYCWAAPGQAASDDIVLNVEDSRLRSS